MLKKLLAIVPVLVSLQGAAPDPASPDRVGGLPSVPPLSLAFEREVTPRLHPPAEVTAAYAASLQDALGAAAVRASGLQFIVLVDRDPRVQALFVYWGSSDDGWVYVGAAPVSTGQSGRYEHFATPLGVYEHTIGNPDFRAEGTKNELGIRGYGLKGSRVYDFGWVRAPKGWGDGRRSVMRLQMHATDPDVLEQRLGTAQSKGCIRIPAALNEFIDRHGVLDADYQEELANGAHFWVLRADRTPTAWPGRYLVVVNSGHATRPPWSPAPRRR
jgi:hypothetical protein